MIKQSLRFWIATGTLCVLAACAAGVYHIVREDRRVTLDNAADAANTAAALMGEVVAANLRDVANGLYSAKADMEDRGGLVKTGPAAVARILRQQFTYKTAVPLVAALDGDGILFAHSTDVEVTRKNYREGPAYQYFSAHRDQSGPYVGPPYFAPSHAKWFLPVSIALRDAEGRLLGILTAQMSVDYLTSVYRAMVRDNKTAVAIANESGVLLSRHPYSTEGLGRPVMMEWVAPFLQSPGAIARVHTLQDPIDQRERIVAATRVADFSLIVLVGLDRHDVLMPWAERMRERVLTLIVGGLVLLCAVAWLTHMLAQHEKSEHLVRALFEVANDAVFVFRGDQVVDCNHQALALFDMTSRDEFRASILLAHSPALQPDGRESKQRARELTSAAGRGTPQIFEWQHLRRDGSVFDAEICLAGFTVDGEKYLVAFDRDITPRKQAEREIRELNERLEAKVEERTRQLMDVNSRLELANKELEAFTYSASHDLRAPAIHMRGFAEMLAGGRGGELNGDGVKWARAIAESGTRMQELIDGLLALSRVGVRELKMEPVDLSAMAHSVYAALRERHPGGFCHFVVADDLRVRGDPVMMRILLENLIENARKYSSKVALPLIEVGRQDHADGCSLFVRDNGAGFDPAKAARLFEPFQRLHSQNEFPGTGVGLATVRRIVARHSGMIWAVSAKGMGATFHFKLPAAV